MRYILQHIGIIIDSYKGEIPLAHYLKNYFKQFPKLGSRDRKLLSSMAYSWYRCSKGINKDVSFEHKVRLCMAWSHNKFPSIFEQAEVVTTNETTVNEAQLFPYDVTFSNGISKEAWLNSMQKQPDLFIRIRKDKGKIISLLNSKEIPFSMISDHCLALPNGASVESLLPPESYVVQDASSQLTGSYFKPKKNESWLDCCAGAGGKSLLLKDMEPGVRLTVSDLRESIIRNLQARFRLYGFELPVAHVTDAADKKQLDKALGNKQFDHIICDAPCSGSGTWARTPEQLFFFNPEGLEKYTSAQRNIAINVSSHLKTGGTLFYITCSVFKTENEDVVENIVKETGLQLVEQHLINGISIKADSMFIAVLKNTSQKDKDLVFAPPNS